MQGLLPLHFSRQTGLPPDGSARESATLTVGAMADSAYEYFLKMWLLTNKTVHPSHLLSLLVQALSPVLLISPLKITGTKPCRVQMVGQELLGLRFVATRRRVQSRQLSPRELQGHARKRTALPP